MTAKSGFEELFGVPRPGNGMSAYVERLERDRAELLAALKTIVDLDDGDKPDLWLFQTEFDAARSLIAKLGEPK